MSASRGLQDAFVEGFTERPKVDRILRHREEETFMNRADFEDVKCSQFVSDFLGFVDRRYKLFYHYVHELKSSTDRVTLSNATDRLQFLIDGGTGSHLNSDVVRRLLQILDTYQKRQNQCEAVNILSHAMFDKCKDLITNDAIPALVKYMSDSYHELGIESVVGLTHLAYSSPDCINFILENHALEDALKIVKETIGMRRIIMALAKFLAVVCRNGIPPHKPQLILYHRSSEVKSPLLHPKPLKQRIMASDPESSGTAVDRISSMPGNIIDLILQRLPIHDAAKMGVLSTTWRDVWVTNPHLVFDDQFFSRLHDEMKRPQPSKSSRIISNILLAHSGPILNFTFHIPMCSLLHDYSLQNPIYLFSCSDLTHLSLFGCILDPPRGFGGFCNLVSVELEYVKITADMSFGTQLEELVLYGCTGIEHLGCQYKNSNNLTLLKIDTTCGINTSKDIDLGWFECVQKVTNLSLRKDQTETSRIKISDLDKLFGNMPRINSLLLEGFTLESLEPGTDFLKRRITTLENLYLPCVEFHQSDKMQYVLCLIKSSPNLRLLYISLCSSPDAKVNSSDVMDLRALWGGLDSRPT
ncbi:hypothetical protein POM88_042245 [Heracleum sosnowskyi]|uniref:F-box domain-containing protein n=1 Tax=Heracleum sosnowskyi TaxID=360622 RepID=A0AAD8HGD6_9APIA|nr:hypothetical protein POM88_042245 [Heracleum sosnowskyi]